VIIGGWKVRARNTRILGKDALEALEKTLGTSHLPEMVYGSTLELTHESTGVRLHFNAEDALKEWLEEGLPPLKVAAAAVWEKGHKARFGDEMPKAAKSKTGDAWNDEEETDKYDWTFTTPYRGSVSVDDGAGAGTTGTDASRPTPSLWTDTEQRVDRGMLMERDPILFFDELTLYESELDDNGLMSLTVKVRVMPRCWYVLMRHWMRVDGVLIRLRETRFFHRLGTPPGEGSVVVRESARREETFEGLRMRGAPSEPGQYPDADEAASVLLAAGGPVEMEYHALTV